MIDELYCGGRSIVWKLPGGGLLAEPDVHPRGLLSGSFNPLHDGHLLLREAAAAQRGGPVHFELSIKNAEKPPIEIAAIEHRLAQFTGHTVVLTVAATFAEKARLFPGLFFVVGTDTAERIVEPRYYGGSRDAMHDSLARIRLAGCRFLVAGRLQSGRFVTLSELPVPRGFDDLFEELPESLFRSDQSSTGLRNGTATPRT